MKKVVFILSGGPIGDLDIIKNRFDHFDVDVLICADGGARCAQRLGLLPQVIIGDMDSLDDEMQNYFEGKGSLIIRHPKDKDETDTQLALQYALTMKPTEVVICGALGGRLDHTLANISLLMAGANEDVPVKLIDEWCELFLVTDKTTIEGEAGQTVSIFPYPEAAAGITLEGFKYPLTEGTMKIGHPYGISNKLAAARGTLSVKSGYLLVIRYFKPGAFPQGE
ncbi:MAG: thiamine diphosphokinase [Deltaproteobacteria bacterium]|nr:thiamine diphosphokinase [Deltaproteobacteria bacterium]